MGLQPRPTSLSAGVSDADGVDSWLGDGLWKRRRPGRFGKRFAFPTFPQPRRLRASIWKCYARNPKPGECLIIPGLKMGGRSRELSRCHSILHLHLAKPVERLPGLGGFFIHV